MLYHSRLKRKYSQNRHRHRRGIVERGRPQKQMEQGLQRVSGLAAASVQNTSSIASCLISYGSRYTVRGLHVACHVGPRDSQRSLALMSEIILLNLIARHSKTVQTAFNSAKHRSWHCYYFLTKRFCINLRSKLDVK